MRGPDSHITLIRAIGGMGLWFMGMPHPVTIGEYPAHPDLHSAQWEKGGLYRGDPYTYAELHAELLILQAFGLIEGVALLPIQLYDRTTLISANFRYTEVGAAAALLEWERWKYRHEEDSEGQF